MINGWINNTIGEICTKITDGSHNPPKGLPYPTDFKMISSQNVFNDVLDCSDVRYLSEADFSLEDKRTRIRRGDVLLTIVGTIGRCAVVKGNEGPITLQRSVAVLSPTDEVLPRFLMYALMGNRENLERESHGIAQKGIYLKQLSKFKISRPKTIDEQQRIVNELDLLASIIDKKNAQLRDLDALAQSIFYEMFGNPVTNDKGWPKKRIGELVHLYNGRAFKPSDWTESGLPIVRIQNLNSPDSPYNFYDGVVDEAYLLKGGELLYAWSGTPGTSFGAHIWKGNKAVLNQHIFKVLFDEKYLNKLYFLYQLNLSVSSLFDQTHGGVGLKHITKGTLENQLVPLPNMELQNSFAQKVLAIDSEKDRLKCSLLQTKTLLESRMSEYFNTK